MSENSSILIQNVLIILSMLFSLTAFIFNYLTNTKRYELAGEYRKEILNWYSTTLHILKKIALFNEKSDQRKEDLLAKLSTQIDVGRFYFPNIQKDDKYGIDKPSAFRGYRNVIIDTLVFYYHIFEKHDSIDQQERLKVLERTFISQVFDQLDPKEYLKQTKKHTNQNFYSTVGYKDFDDRRLIEINDYLKENEPKHK